MPPARKSAAASSPAHARAAGVKCSGSALRTASAAGSFPRSSSARTTGARKFPPNSRSSRRWASRRRDAAATTHAGSARLSPGAKGASEAASSRAEKSFRRRPKSSFHRPGEPLSMSTRLPEARPVSAENSGTAGEKTIRSAVRLSRHGERKSAARAAAWSWSLPGTSGSASPSSSGGAPASRGSAARRKIVANILRIAVVFYAFRW